MLDENAQADVQEARSFISDSLNQQSRKLVLVPRLIVDNIFNFNIGLAIINRSLTHCFALRLEINRKAIVRRNRTLFRQQL